MLIEIDGLVKFMKGSGSYGLVLNGLLGVNDALFVEDAVPAVSAFDSIIGLQLGLLSALSIMI